MNFFITRSLLLAAILLCEGRALALPFKIDIGALGRQAGEIEVADPSGQVILRHKLGKLKHLSPDLKVDGLYSLTITRSGRQIWKENFFVVLKRPVGETMLKTSWQTKPGLMRTVLKVQDPKGEIRYGVSIKDKIFLRLRGAPRLVRVQNEDYTGAASPASSLAFETMGEKQAAEESARDNIPISIDGAESEDDQKSFEPEYKGLFAGKEDKTWREKVLALGANRRLVPMGRQHRVHAWLRLMQEEFSIRRGTDNFTGEKSTGLGMGFASNIVFKETMTLQLEVDTHGTKTSYDKAGDRAPAEEQKRVHARLGPLLDILNVEHNYPNQSIELGPVIGYTMTPIEDDNQGKVDFGGAFRWQYIAASRLEFQMRYMKSHSYDTSLTWIGESSLWSVNPLFGFYLYHTEQTSGEAEADFDEYGLRLGVSRAF